MDVQCQCGAVSFRTPSSVPQAVFHCHCTECQAQSASAFGTSAVFPTDGIFPLGPDLEAKLGLYNRPAERADSGRMVRCYFCKTCGVRLMHLGIEKDGNPRSFVSVKGGNIKGLDWSSAIHIYTDSAVVPIPPGVKSFPRSPPPFP